jgi:hypothetical protein
MNAMCLLMVAALATRLHVLPAPRQVEEIGKPLSVADGTVVCLSPALAHDDDAAFAADQLVAALKDLGVQAAVKVAPPAGTCPWIAMGIPERDPKFASLVAARGLKLTDDMAAEGYALSVAAEGAVLAAATPAGLFYGVQTLRQMLEPRGRGFSLPGARLHDWPALHLRGILHDTARMQVPTYDMARRIIDFCAYYKLNTYNPFIEHTFAWAGHEDIWQGSGAWTPQQYIDLCKYARPRHVLVIPQLEEMGHQTHILMKPAYKDLAETGGWSFAPAVEGTYTLLEDLMSQMCRAFLFHPFFGIGCDEVGDLGAGKSKALMEKLGGKAQLFAYHIKRINDILKKYGRRPMMWGDEMLNHPESMGMVPKDVIVLDWHYGASKEYPSVKQFRDAGYDVVVCPALSNWSHIYPDLPNAFPNIQNLTAEGQKYGAMGAMTCAWGDVGEVLINRNWYGWAWAAACAWSDAAQQEREQFNRDFCQTFFGTSSSDLADAQGDMAEANGAFPWSGGPVGYFHADPFAMADRPAKARVAALAKLTESAQKRLADGDKQARTHRENLVFLNYSAKMYAHVLHRAAGMDAASQGYTSAYETDDAKAREAGLRACVAALQPLQGELAALRDEWRTLWLAEDNPECLPDILARFDNVLKAYDARIAAVNDALAKGGKLQPPEALGLQTRETRAGTAVERGDLAPPAPWWDDRRPFRMALRLQAGDFDRPAGLPVLVRLNLAQVCGQDVDPASARLVIGDKAHPAQVVPLWTPDGPLPGRAVAFLLPQAVAKGAALDAALYWAPAGANLPAAETDLRVEAKPDQVWFENARMRAMLGSEGAHLYVWQIKALGGFDVTQPGEKDWAGFLDLGGKRVAPFDLKVLATGPVVAMVHCTEPGGVATLVSVWAGLPIVDMQASEPQSWFWNYDDTAAFAADAPMPGLGRFEDGSEQPVPKGTETIHLQPGRPVWWGAKYRPDGLTEGLITPSSPTSMMIGPGGGWGGVGMDYSAPTDRYVTYCDVAPEKWKAVAALADSLRADRPMRALSGPMQRK